MTEQSGELKPPRWSLEDVQRVLYLVIRRHEQAHAHLGGDSELLVDAVRIARETLIDNEWWPEDERDLPERRLRVVDGELAITPAPWQAEALERALFLLRCAHTGHGKWPWSKPVRASHRCNICRFIVDLCGPEEEER